MQGWMSFESTLRRSMARRVTFDPELRRLRVRKLDRGGICRRTRVAVDDDGQQRVRGFLAIWRDELSDAR
jgi:hypothetical protein